MEVAEKARLDRESKAGSVYVGEIGGKFEGELTVYKVVTCETAYGESFLHLMQDAVGNQFTWFSSSNNLEIGPVVLKGSIKDHKEYKGVKQTVLTRCKVRPEVGVLMKGAFIIKPKEKQWEVSKEEDEVTAVFKTKKMALAFAKKNKDRWLPMRDFAEEISKAGGVSYVAASPPI
jgi:hypothetical protein